MVTSYQHNFMTSRQDFRFDPLVFDLEKFVLN